MIVQKTATATEGPAGGETIQKCAVRLAEDLGLAAMERWGVVVQENWDLLKVLAASVTWSISRGPVRTGSNLSEAAKECNVDRITARKVASFNIF